MIEDLKTLIKDFHLQKLPEPLINRDLSVPLDIAKIISIIGPRRAGKTYFLFTLIRKLDKEVGRERIVYINFEDERLNIETSDLQLIIDAYQQLYPDTPLSEVYFFFDEIQEVKSWEKFTRRLLDTISFHIFVTGSSSKLFSSEIASSLRGRTLAYSLMPFSFREYLRYIQLDAEDRHSSRNRNLLSTAFERFLVRGGYPEVLEFDTDLFTRTLQSYVDIMLFRDIIERHGIRSVHLVKEMARRFIADNTRLFSVNKCYRDFKSRGLQVSKDSLYRFFDFFSDTYFTLPLHKYDTSFSKQALSLKKVYLNDTGFMTAFTFSLSPDRGPMLEALIFLELFKMGAEMFYFSDQGECDFLVLEGSKASRAIQVCSVLNEQNRTRELRGLTLAMKRFSLKDGWVITSGQEEDIKTDPGMVHLLPAWKWIIEMPG